MSATRVLTGARWSSAVRCPTRAQHEALGTVGDDQQQAWLKPHFTRGVNLADAWAKQQLELLKEEGKRAETEYAVPWGPPEYEWEGHADLVNLNDAIVTECYHAASGTFREEKALQAAGYSDALQILDGRSWRAMLAVIDSTDIDEDHGLAVHTYPVAVNGLRPRIHDIRDRVITAVQAGAPNMADRVSDTPFHAECRSCPFTSVCHADYQPLSPDEIPGLEDTFEALRVTETDLHHKSGDLASTKARRDALREELRPYLPAGRSVISGGTLIRRTEVAGRTSVKLGDYRKAGHTIPADLEPFITESAPSERWKVEPA